jgi:hypothetical protein
MRRYVVIVNTMLLAALALAGCAAREPIATIAHASIPASKPARLSEVAAAIQRAGKAAGWRMSAEAPGILVARRELRSHVAVVEIEHSTSAYSIRYRESVNLDAGNGRIHRAFNDWVKSLDRAIQAQLRGL